MCCSSVILVCSDLTRASFEIRSSRSYSSLETSRYSDAAPRRHLRRPTWRHRIALTGDPFRHTSKRYLSALRSTAQSETESLASRAASDDAALLKPGDKRKVPRRMITRCSRTAFLRVTFRLSPAALMSPAALTRRYDLTRSQIAAISVSSAGI
jgi:hypothetical protein